MRTVPYIEVWNDVVTLYGLNPNKEIKPEVTRSINRYINKRVEFICEVWPWPQWLLTEERAFRQVWHADAQYLQRSVTDGQPDELFYIPNTTYYRVLDDSSGGSGGDPPVGTLPTDATFFKPLSPVDTFIAYDQPCKRSIGMALGIYTQNPRVNASGYCNGNVPIDFRPSEKGIDVPCGTGPTVFLHYKMPVPKFTMIPWVSGKTYQKGQIVFDPTSGECFQALAPTTALPNDALYWRRVPFPEDWKDYVCEGAFADSLMEFDQSGAVSASPYTVQERQALVQFHTAAAENAIQSKINVLSSQGQKFYWHYSRPRYSGLTGWCCSQPWSGGTVSTLTDACEDELGWIYPTTFPEPQVADLYYNKVVALRAFTATPSLDQIATRILLSGSLAQIVIPVDGRRTHMLYELVEDAADPNDPDGQVQPLDYDPDSNDKHWSALQ